MNIKSLIRIPAIVLGYIFALLFFPIVIVLGYIFALLFFPIVIVLDFSAALLISNWEVGTLVEGWVELTLGSLYDWMDS